MAVFSIPLQSGLYDYTVDVTLDGEQYHFGFRWNDRGQIWFMDLFDSAGTPLAVGRRMSVGTAPIDGLHYIAGMPPGQLYIVDTAGTDLEATESDLGTRVKLLYYDAAENLQP